MDLSGLENRIYNAVSNIDLGRKGFATRGKERKGRIAYENGIADALSAFEEVHVSADTYTIIYAEYTFLNQELYLCDTRDQNALTSLTFAIESLDDAFRVLKIVENRAHYKIVEESYPRRSKYRVKGFPRDAFHIACASHRTRLKNMLSTIGLDLIEKSLLEQRRLNLTTAQNSYVKKQKIALTALKPSKINRLRR